MAHFRIGDRFESTANHKVGTIVRGPRRASANTWVIYDGEAEPKLQGRWALRRIRTGEKPNRDVLTRFLAILERELPAEIVVGQPMNLTNMEEADVVQSTMAWLRTTANG